MRYRDPSIASRSVVTARVAVAAGVSAQIRTEPVAVSGAIGARIIAPPVFDAVRSHQRAAANPRHRTRLKGDQAVAIASLRSLRRKQQLASIGDH